MSIVIETFLICDGHCGENFGVDDRHETGKQHRENAKENGWKLIKNKDYCPLCAQKLKTNTTTNDTTTGNAASNSQ